MKKKHSVEKSIYIPYFKNPSIMIEICRDEKLW